MKMKLKSWHLYVLATLCFLFAFTSLNMKYDRFYRVNGIDNDNRSLIEKYLDKEEQDYLIDHGISVDEFIDYITYDQFHLQYYQYYNELKEAMIESIRQQSAPQEQIDTMIQQLNYSFAQAERMMLSLWFCACSIITYIMAKLVSYIGRRTNTVHRELPPMATWRMPIWGAGVLAIGIIIIYGLSYIGYDNSLLKDIGMNVAFVGAFA